METCTGQCLHGASTLPHCDMTRPLGTRCKRLSPKRRRQPHHLAQQARGTMPQIFIGRPLAKNDGFKLDVKFEGDPS